MRASELPDCCIEQEIAIWNIQRMLIIIRSSITWCCHKMMITYWGWDKMANILQTTFSNTFYWMKMLEFHLKSDWNCVQKSHRQYASICVVNGLAMIRWQVIIWTNDGIVYWCIYASLDLSDLKNENSTTMTNIDFKSQKTIHLSPSQMSYSVSDVRWERLSY